MRGEHTNFFSFQPLHRVRHPADGGREPQVLPQPRGVRLRLPQPLPGHRQPLHVPPRHLRQQELGPGRKRERQKNYCVT